MRVYYDTEFVERGHESGIGLISIGMVAEDGREYYAVNRDLDVVGVAASPWLREHVWPQIPKIPGVARDAALAGIGWRNRLTRDPVLRTARVMDALFNRGHSDVKHRRRIAVEVENFLRESGDVELWSWFGAYDHVVLAQLWGSMVNLPKRVPMYTHDLQQEADRLGVKIPDEYIPQHHALWCAHRHARIGLELQSAASDQSDIEYPGRPGDLWDDSDGDTWICDDHGKIRMVLRGLCDPYLVRSAHGTMTRHIFKETPR